MQQRMVQELVRTNTASIISPDTSIRSAALILLQSECDLLAVRNFDGTLAGVVGESSVVRSLLANDSETQSVRPLIVSHVETIRLSASLSSVVHLFRSACNTAVPVLDDNQQLVGLLHRRDAIETMLASTDDQQAAVSSGDFANPSVKSSINNPPRGLRTRIDEARTDSDRSDSANSRSSSNQSGSGDAASRTNSAAPDSAADGNSDQSDLPSGPYFLRGQEARRRLQLPNRGFGDVIDPPW